MIILAIIDSVSYDDEAPWPVEADGQGFSLELIDIESDNSIAESCKASEYMQGSPGIENGILINNEKIILIYPLPIIFRRIIQIHLIQVLDRIYNT